MATGPLSCPPRSSWPCHCLPSKQVCVCPSVRGTLLGEGWTVDLGLTWADRSASLCAELRVPWLPPQHTAATEKLGLPEVLDAPSLPTVCSAEARTTGFSAWLCSPPGTGFPCGVPIPLDLLQRGFDKPGPSRVCRPLSLHRLAAAGALVSRFRALCSFGNEVPPPRTGSSWGFLPQARPSPPGRGLSEEEF